ncbi:MULTISPECIES: hypothetical protein [unclassified Frankia]|nr:MULTISPECIES: hypothetical protein [unclassified Frankia]
MVISFDLLEVYRGAPPPIPATIRYNLAVGGERETLAADGTPGG